VVERDVAALDALGEVEDVPELLARQTARAEPLGRRRQQLGREWRAAIEEGEHAAVDRRGGLSRELLVDDRAAERVEVRPLGAGDEAAGTDEVDDRREPRVGGPEVRDGVGVHGGRIIRGAAGRPSPLQAPGKSTVGSPSSQTLSMRM
jgi:hypothetical protein